MINIILIISKNRDFETAVRTATSKKRTAEYRHFVIQNRGSEPRKTISEPCTAVHRTAVLRVTLYFKCLAHFTWRLHKPDMFLYIVLI